MPLREKVNWVLRMVLMLFILASVAFLSALTAMRYAVQGREVVLPDITGQHATEAERLLQARGLGMKVEDRVYNNLPLDEIVRQSPPPNSTVKTGQLAHVVLSLGPRKETIPELEDRSVRAARIELLQSGMQVGEVSSAYLPGTEEDTVLQQDPANGTTDLTSPHVNLLVSLGSRPSAYVMPDLMGLPMNEAISKLNGAGLKIAKITTVSTPGAVNNAVVSQTPPRGRLVDGNAAISLQVAD
jgi:beta-lactam-binding protein with PASTA domain